jgi:phospholipase C
MKENTLLTQYHAVRHPSLPNYVALIGGDTFNITSDCTSCTINQTALPDLIEKSGRSWKAYEEDIPSPCFLGDSGNYMQKHDPFVYFDPIRNDTARCKQRVVPFTQMAEDLKNNQFPSFAFITPNMCHDGHNCNLQIVDDWLKKEIGVLQSSPALGSKWLIVVLFDEGTGGNDAGCCGLKETGGRVPAVLISPQVKPGFEDNTPYPITAC